MMEIHLRLKRNKKKEWSIFDQSIIKNIMMETMMNLYTIYLYTSHYIENITYWLRVFRWKIFGHPVYANIISQNDIDAYEQFYKSQTGVAIYKAFRTCTNGIKNYKEKGGKYAFAYEFFGSMSNILDSKYSDYLTALDTVGITNTTDILATGVKIV